MLKALLTLRCATHAERQHPRQRSAAAPDAPQPWRTAPSGHPATYPPFSIQHRFWTLQQLNPTDASSHAPFGLRLCDHLDVRLWLSFRQLRLGR